MASRIRSVPSKARASAAVDGAPSVAGARAPTEGSAAGWSGPTTTAGPSSETYVGVGAGPAESEAGPPGRAVEAMGRSSTATTISIAMRSTPPATVLRTSYPLRRTTAVGVLPVAVACTVGQDRWWVSQGTQPGPAS